MRVNGTPYRTIWLAEDGWSVDVIDQTRLPHEFATLSLKNLDDAAAAIRTMVVRGAPLIGATAAYGVCLAMRADPGDASLSGAYDKLLATRPTAVNLRWALDEIRAALAPLPADRRVAAAYAKAAAICDDDAETCHSIGRHGAELIQAAWERAGKARPVNVLTHCNAGWLATVDWGTALAPIYQAHDAGVPVHVWVDETRPRNQGAALTAWELGSHGVDHTVIVDNAGGHLMQHGEVDLCITGTDRTTSTGDVCNKIGTYLKALAAYDNGVPFYVALPYSTIDWTLADGVKEIPIEQRDATEVTDIAGQTPEGAVTTVRVTPGASRAANYAFDVTPARLVTGLITERGVCPASAEGLLGLYPRARGVSTPTREQATAANRAAWDASADYHRGDPQWRALLDGFATPGFSVLDAVETEMFERLGVAGRSVAQLCCNNGREILSAKNLGAARCVGFDQSAKFIEQGRELAAAGGIEAELIVTDVYAIEPAYDGAFDVVLVTIGAIGWMPDLAAFVAVAARLLRPGGHLFMHEQHPIVDMFDPHSPTPFEPTEPYFTDRPNVSDQPIVYHGQQTEAVNESYWYTHTLADIFRACLGNGLAIRDFQEYPDNISSVEWAKYEQRAARLPLSYALLAQKE